MVTAEQRCRGLRTRGRPRGQRTLTILGMEVAGAVRRLWSRPVALSLTLACAAAPLTLAQEARLFVSSRAGDRLTEKPAVRFAPAMSGPATFRLDPSVTHQTIVGFGASFLEAGMVCLNSLEPVQQEAVLRALFHPETGAGFSAMKTAIAATDFMSAGPWYSYADAPGDVELKSFSIARDLGPNGLVTYIRRARRYGSFVLVAIDGILRRPKMPAEQAEKLVA